MDSLSFLSQVDVGDIDVGHVERRRVPEDDRTHGPVSSITVPTLVVHGTADPMFPIEHGEALADAIPGAQLLRLADAGHGIDRTDWDRVVPAILKHTSRPEPT